MKYRDDDDYYEEPDYDGEDEDLDEIQENIEEYLSRQLGEYTYTDHTGADRTGTGGQAGGSSSRNTDRSPRPDDGSGDSRRTGRGTRMDGCGEEREEYGESERRTRPSSGEGGYRSGGSRSGTTSHDSSGRSAAKSAAGSKTGTKSGSAKSTGTKSGSTKNGSSTAKGTGSEKGSAASKSRKNGEETGTGRTSQSRSSGTGGKSASSGKSTSSERSRSSGNVQKTKSAKKAGSTAAAVSGGSRAGRNRYEDDYDDYDYEDDYGEEERKTPSRKKRRKHHNPLLKILLVIVILLLVVCGIWYIAVGKIYSTMHYEEIPAMTAQSMKDDGVINILLVGNDSRDNDEDGRSDAMILLSISKKTRTIQMMSLLRDMYVQIPGYQDNRLNAAYSYGGAELLMETLEQNFGIEINRYIQVNFEAFAGLVDAVGGVDLELTNGEVQYVNGYLTEYNVLTERPEGTDYLDSTLEGEIHLNGPQALAYCRIRYIGTDFARTERQRKVLTAVIKKIPATLLKNPTGLISGLFPNLTTNLTRSECMSLSLQIFNLASYDIVSSSIPLTGTYTDATIRGMSVLQVDFEANIAYIRECLYGD